MSASEHRALAPDAPLACAVVTISDTRTEATDASGDLARQRLADAGHRVVASHIVPDEADAVRETLQALAGQVDVVVATGGTGIAARDRTIEVADRLIQKPIPGFGELFRMLSFPEIGAAAMLSRATAGLYGDASDTLLFCCPGSPHAVALALDRLIVPELHHAMWEVVRQRSG